MGRPSKWSPEFREEPSRLYRESGDEIERGACDGTTREEHAEIVKLRQPRSVSGAGPDLVAWLSVTGEASAGA
jgi:hypothetical protein